MNFVYSSYVADEMLMKPLLYIYVTCEDTWHRQLSLLFGFGS